MKTVLFIICVLPITCLSQDFTKRYITSTGDTIFVNKSKIYVDTGKAVTSIYPIYETSAGALLQSLALRYVSNSMPGRSYRVTRLTRIRNKGKNDYMEVAAFKIKDNDIDPFGAQEYWVNIEDGILRKEIKINNKLKNFDYRTIIDPSKFHAKNKVVIQNIYDKYKQYRATINYRTTSSGFENMMQWLRNEAEDIIFSSEEIVWWASQFGTGFVIDVFGEDLKNVLKEKYNNIIAVPYKSDIGYILYMGSKYKIEKFLI